MQVLLTRPNDKFVELDERARLANNFHADLFVSIHADWNPSSWKEGHSILLPQWNDTRATLAARCVSRAMQSAGSACHIIRRDTRGLIVLKKTKGPSILVEMGFLSNAEDARQLASGSYRGRLAEAIAAGIADYLAR